MIHLGLQPRRIVAEDYHQISNLIFYEANIHRHLDWRSPLEWIGSRNYWALEEYGQLVAAFACPEDPPQVAWIRFFAHQPRYSAREAWAAMWESARGEMLERGAKTQVASIVTRQWFQNLLFASGFHSAQNIVLLSLKLDVFPHFSPPQDFNIRPMCEEDLRVCADIDLESFGAFWHNTEDTIRRARSVALCATVAEDDSGVIAYQISTGNLRGIHLARLAVSPNMQGRGVGSALINDLIYRTGRNHISVNTQQDNAASLALYKKMGFFRTGENFPVLVYSIS